MISINSLINGQQFTNRYASRVTTVARGKANPFLFHFIESKVDPRWCEENVGNQIDETQKEEVANDFQLEIRLVKLGYVGITIH